MIVTYSPEDNAPQRWEFKPKRVRASQAEMVEKRYGHPWDKFLADLIGGSIQARRVLLWHLTRLDHPALRFEDTPDFFAGEFTVEFSREELEDMRDALAKVKELSDEEKAQGLAVLDAEIEKAPAGVDEGKAQ